MFTINQAARLTGVREATLRTWERRYAVVAPRRTPSGYRLYSDEMIAVLTTMRRLVDAGWSAAEAARAIREGDVSVSRRSASPGPAQDLDRDDAAGYMELFLASAARMDTEGIEKSLDGGFSLGSFEHVVDTWLCPSLVALGEGWARGEIDVAGEHTAAHAVVRRLSAAFEAAGSRSRGPTVVVGLPAGSLHQLGALAFATAIRRRGLDVLYLGPSVPAASWEAAVASRSAHAAVLGVVTAADRPSATITAQHLLDTDPGLLVACGGAFAAHLTAGVHTLATPIGAAAVELDQILHEEPTEQSGSGPEGGSP